MDTKIFALCLLVISLASCTSVYTIVPEARIENPEVSADGRQSITQLGIRYLPATEYEFASDASQRPLVVNTTYPSKNSSQYNFDGVYNIERQIDLQLTAIPTSNFNVIWRPQIKWQFYGTTSEQINTIGSRASAYAGLVYSRDSNSGNQRGQFGPGGYGWKSYSEMQGLNLGASYGYRFDRKSMIYSGLAIQPFDVRAKIHQDYVDSTYTEQNYEFPKSYGVSKNVSVGYIYGDYSKFNIELSYIENQLNNHINWRYFLAVGFTLDLFSKKEN